VGHGGGSCGGGDFEVKSVSRLTVCRKCVCVPVSGVLESFILEERRDMVEDDSKVRVTCEYCSRVYELEGPG